jgi:hypothetical protein
MSRSICSSASSGSRPSRSVVVSFTRWAPKAIVTKRGGRKIDRRRTSPNSTADSQVRPDRVNMISPSGGCSSASGRSLLRMAFPLVEGNLAQHPWQPSFVPSRIPGARSKKSGKTRELSSLPIRSYPTQECEPAAIDLSATGKSPVRLWYHRFIGLRHDLRRRIGGSVAAERWTRETR